ncbi:hypothetical protein Ctob_002056 [Chrysochromulina tobinii]|uniref:Transcription initiation factor tfiid subunit 10 n=1 Tax=Chrysochromulina tobinii TaxID=1460289 RepID=A0A0M0J3B8_9EUKA|nr:hypothetical protein Ctob_002056 [Chrysochromulina tobinii]|eukprot:KOO21010.1 hypothetical protein Ctob_002056 [Chrysochromulina sp. CCMP291]
MASSASVPAALGDDAQASAAAEELLRAMESYQPIVPDAVTQYYLGLSGYQQQKGRLTLTTEDLMQSAREYGIYIRKPMYFADGDPS